MKREATEDDFDKLLWFAQEVIAIMKVHGSPDSGEGVLSWLEGRLDRLAELERAEKDRSRG